MTDAFSRILNSGSAPTGGAPSSVRGADAFSRIIGTAPTEVGTPPADPNGNREVQGFVGSLRRMVRGEHDTRFKNMPTVYEQFSRELEGPAGMAATLGASDEQLSDVMQQALGDRFVRREADANGYPIIVTRRPDGQEQSGYVNRPGLDSQDVTRTIRGALPYAATGGAGATAARGAGWVGHTIVQAGAAGSTSVAGDLAQLPMGSEQGVEPEKALINTVAGAAGPTISKVGSALWRRFVTEPSLYDRVTGVLTDKGAQIAREAGFDPTQMAADIQREFGKTYARSGGDANAAAAVIADKEFNIPSTVGQRSKDPQRLMDEKAARYGVYGDAAKSVLRGFDAQQAEAVKAAALTGTPESAGIMKTIAPGRSETDFALSNVGNDIRIGMQSALGQAQAGEQAAWSKVTDITPKPQAFDSLPEMLSGRLGDLPIDQVNTKTAASMAKALDEYVSGKALTEPVAKVLKQAPVTTLDQMRRRLLAMSRAADNGTDRKAATAIYDGFNDWIDDAAEKALVNGDADAAAALRTARDTSKTMRQIFQPTTKRGMSTPAAKIIDDVIERSDSAEGIVSGLFGGGPSSNIKDGSVEALKYIQVALRRYANPEVAGKTWNDVRAAYWMRLVKGKNGDMLSPTVMMENIKLAMHNQRSLIHVLYKNDEIAQMIRFQQALRQISYRDPNPSGSAVGFASLTKQFLGKILDSVPFGKAAFERSGIPDAYGAAVAKRAVATISPQAPNRMITPYIQPAGQLLMTEDEY